MLPQCAHITRKRGIYHYRRRIPAPHAGEVLVSLGTRNYREAQHLAAVLDRAFTTAMTDAPATSGDVAAALRRYLKDAIALDLEQHREARPGRPVYTTLADKHDDPVEADLEVIDHLLSDAREALARRDYRSVRSAVDALMAEERIAEERRREVALGVLAANVKMLEVARGRVLGHHPELDGALTDPLPAPSVTPLAPAADPPLAGPALSTLLPAFLAHQREHAGWKEQTVAQNAQTYRMFTEWAGDLPIKAYTRTHCTGFYDLLLKLPSDYGKAAAWRDKPLSEVVRLSESNSAIQRLSMKTAKRHFSALGALFTFYKRRGEYEAENPAHGHAFPKKVRARAARQMWKGDKLTALFKSPVWTGCHPTFRSQPGDQIIRDARFWLPILGLYHGNRLEEFAQLRREDVAQSSEGIWYFNITDDDGRQIKNEQSRRRVPLHPELERLGFLAYVEATAPSASDRVFPDLLPGGPDKKVGFFFTKWFSAYRRAIGLYERGLDYHSFRHGVTTKLYDAAVSEAWIDELVGHEGKGTSRAVYKKGTSLVNLADALRRIEWPEVDLSHLYVTSNQV